MLKGVMCIVYICMLIFFVNIFFVKYVFWVLKEVNNFGKILCFFMYKYIVSIFLMELVRFLKVDFLNIVIIWKIICVFLCIK